MLTDLYLFGGPSSRWAAAQRELSPPVLNRPGKDRPYLAC